MQKLEPRTAGLNPKKIGYVDRVIVTSLEANICVWTDYDILFVIYRQIMLYALYIMTLS